MRTHSATRLRDRSRHAEATGVALIEATVSFLVFLTTLIAIIDFARVMTIRSRIKAAADGALRTARVIDGFEIDTKYAESGDITKFTLAYRAIESAARLAAGPYVADMLEGESSADEVVSFAHSFELNGDSNLQIKLILALLRPGEECTDDLSGEQFVYPLRDQTGTEVSFDLMRMSERLRRYPILILLRAKVKPLLPFMDSYALEARSFGFRERGAAPSKASSPPLAEEPYPENPDDDSDEDPPPSDDSSGGEDPPDCPQGTMWDSTIGLCVADDNG